MRTQEAVKYFRGKSKLAAALKISPAAVSQWGMHIPKLRQFELQLLTKGALRIDKSAMADLVAA